MSGSNGGSSRQGGHYASTKLDSYIDPTALVHYPVLSTPRGQRSKDGRLSPYGYDVRGVVWQCPRCRTRLRENQIHICHYRHSVAMIYFVNGKAEYRAS